MSRQKKSDWLADKISSYMEKDILNLSKEEVEEEMMLIGRNINQSSDEVSAILSKSLIQSGKQKLKLARENIDRNRNNGAGELARIQMSPERARDIYRKIISENKNLTLAARNESELSDDDIADILDDFRSLGLLNDDQQ